MFPKSFEIGSWALGLFWGLLVGRFGALLSQPGALLGRLGALSGRQGPIAAVLGVFWSRLTALLGPSWAVLVPSRKPLGLFWADLGGLFCQSGTLRGRTRRTCWKRKFS